jgi:hypothetical protein
LSEGGVFVWQLLIEADNELDLADPERGKVWLWKQRWLWYSPRTVHDDQSVEMDYRGWNAKAAKGWREGVLVLRAVVARCRNKASVVNEEKMDEGAAESLTNRYLGKVTPYTTLESNLALKLQTPGLGYPFAPEKDAYPIVPYFFARVITSLVVEDLVTNCSVCGAFLPPTPTGRKNQQKTCAKCRRKLWWDSLSPAEQKRRTLDKEKNRKPRNRRKKATPKPKRKP